MPVEGEGRWRRCVGENGAGGDESGQGWSGREMQPKRVVPTEIRESKIFNDIALLAVRVFFPCVLRC
jgi:hypothetical protein